jgi:hypothetical protein
MPLRGEAFDVKITHFVYSHVCVPSHPHGYFVSQRMGLLTVVRYLPLVIAARTRARGAGLVFQPLGSS